MAYLKKISVDDGIKISINSRVGAFLSEQRTASRKSLRAIARKLKISRAKIRDWEHGKSSPQCDVFFRIVSFYGKEALRSAMELDFQFQIEKYNRLTEQQKSKEAQAQKCPAVIWAESPHLSAVA